MAAGRATARRGGTPRRGARAMVPWVAWGLGVLVVAGGLVLADRRWQAANDVDPDDPTVRVAGAVRSIAGANSVRHAEFDAGTKAARVDATSQYYDTKKSLKENREYLATEGRLAAQLALYENAAVGAVTIRLFSRRTLLATVIARQGQKYEEMKVEYSGPLVPP